MKRTALGLLLGLLGFLIGTELIFRVLPVGTATETGYHIDPLILGYPPHHTWRVASGWDLRNRQTLRSNNLGFAADRDFTPDPNALVLIGDSFVEASSLESHARPGMQLAAFLHHQRAVYAMGSPGSSLLDYAERVRFAYHNLDARDFVILMEAGDVRQSICGSGNVHARCLDGKTLLPRTETLAPPTTIKGILRQSALAQYVFSQLKPNFARLAATVFARAGPDASGQREAERARTRSSKAELRELSEEGRRRVDAVAEAFQLRIEEVAPMARIMFIADGGRSAKHNPPSEIELELERFVAIARGHGRTVLHGSTVFAEHYARSPASLSLSPHDDHMNANAVGLLMRATAEALRDPTSTLP